MREVFIGGAGLTPVGEHWEQSLRDLALEAVVAAQQDAAASGGPAARPEALFVGNMLAGELSGQEHLGALIADYAGLRGIEAVTVEAAGASGGAALRQAVLAVGSGTLRTPLSDPLEDTMSKLLYRLGRFAARHPWRIIGASSCFLKDKNGAVAAWNKLSTMDRQFLKYVCSRNAITVP